MTWNPAPASAGTWCRQSRPESGKPCSRTTGDPSPVTSYSIPTPSTSTRANASSFSPARGPACHCPGPAGSATIAGMCGHADLVAAGGPQFEAALASHVTGNRLAGGVAGVVYGDELA